MLFPSHDQGGVNPGDLFVGIGLHGDYTTVSNNLIEGIGNNNYADDFIGAIGFFGTNTGRSIISGNTVQSWGFGGDFSTDFAAPICMLTGNTDEVIVTDNCIDKNSTDVPGMVVGARRGLSVTGNTINNAGGNSSVLVVSSASNGAARTISNNAIVAPSGTTGFDSDVI